MKTLVKYGLVEINESAELKAARDVLDAQCFMVVLVLSEKMLSDKMFWRCGDSVADHLFANNRGCILRPNVARVISKGTLRETTWFQIMLDTWHITNYWDNILFCYQTRWYSLNSLLSRIRVIISGHNCHRHGYGESGITFSTMDSDGWRENAITWW